MSIINCVQPGYSLRLAANQDLHLAEQQPDSLDEQDDRPVVQCTDLESSVIGEIPFIDDEAVSDEAPLGLVEDNSAEQAGIRSTAKAKSEFVIHYHGAESGTYFFL